ncbi:MAG: glycosyltransferase [Azospirillum sp.]|nr:glycosyltransferase [Azospirillum sp.]
MTDSPAPSVSSRAVPSLSVVLSFYNEEGNLPEMVARLRKALTSECAKGTISSYELIFVNDASTDRSAAILTEEAAKGDVRLITMSRNFGHTPCLIAGMEATTGDLVVYLDADLQDPPETIADMLAKWWSEDDVDVVNTVRLSRAGEPRLKLWVTRLGYAILAKTINIPFLQDAGDFKLMSRRVVDHLLGMKEALPFFRGLIYWIGFKQVVLPYHREPRFCGSSKIVGFRVINYFLFYAIISFSTTPLLLTVLAGLMVSGIAFLVLLHAIFAYLFVGGIPTGWASLIAVISLLGGMQLMATGVNGLYINSIFSDTKRRPLYIVRSMVGFPEPKSGGRCKAPVVPD